MELAAPESMGFDRQALARISQFLDEHYVAPDLLPGAQLLIARRGVPIHFSTHGYARESDRRPLAADAIYRLASMTKPITSVAFMMLVEEAKVSLHQAVQEVVPEFGSLGVYAGGGDEIAFRTTPLARPMLMIDLLRHTSGLTYDFQYRTNVDAAYRQRKLQIVGSELALDEFVAEVGQLPLEFSPGQAWNYSVSTDVLGLVIERISGRPLDAFIRERIFAPLQMADTDFHVPQEKLDRFTDAWVLRQDGTRELYDAAASSRWLGRPRLISGGGGLLSTISDYHRFCSMMLSGGSANGTRILSRKTIELMTTNSLGKDVDLTAFGLGLYSDGSFSSQGFGLGFAVNLSPMGSMTLGTAGEYHWSGVFNTFFFIDPVEQISAIFMAQVMPSFAYPLRKQIRTLVYAALAD